jgi:hypothetical protein
LILCEEGFHYSRYLRMAFVDPIRRAPIERLCRGFRRRWLKRAEEVSLAVPKVGNPRRRACPGTRELGGYDIEVLVSPIPVGSCAVEF